MEKDEAIEAEVELVMALMRALCRMAGGCVYDRDGRCEYCDEPNPDRAE